MFCHKKSPPSACAPLDSTFGTGGKVTTSGLGSAYPAALQSDDKIVVAGSDRAQFTLARYNADASLDTSFSGSGTAVASFSQAGTTSSLAIQADGMILLSGTVSSNHVGLARFSTTGSLDSGFGTSGTQTASLTTTVNAMRLASDGKIVVAGSSGGNFSVLRFNTDGSADTTFDTDGKLTTDLGGIDFVSALVIGPDYKVTAVGSSASSTFPFPSDFALARYKISSSLEQRLYATTDANHNVTSIDDVFGAVKERFVYDPYRNSTVLTSAWASTSDGYSWAVRSQGEREDALTNTIDGRSRIYGLGVGRWLQADFAGYVDGVNRYQFVDTNPIARVDPDGFQEKPADEKNFISGLGIRGIGFSGQVSAPWLSVAWTYPENYSGHIVQHVKVSVWIWDCRAEGGKYKERDDLEKKVLQGTAPISANEGQYWESWHIVDGTRGRDRKLDDGTIKTIPEEKLYDDTFSTGSFAYSFSGTFGYLSIEGWASLSVNDPQFIQKNNPAKTWPGVLPSSKDKPAGWNDKGAVYHYLVWRWNHPFTGTDWNSVEASPDAPEPGSKDFPKNI